MITEEMTTKRIQAGYYDPRRQSVMFNGDIYQGREIMPFYKITTEYEENELHQYVEHLGTDEKFILSEDVKNVRNHKYIGNIYETPTLLEQIIKDGYMCKTLEPFTGFDDEKPVSDEVQQELLNDGEEDLSEEKTSEQPKNQKKLEFKLIAPTNDVFATNIEFNFEEMKNIIVAKTEKYKTTVYSENEIQQAKADRAKLKKLAETINNEKIRIKKEVNKYYSENFEPKVKEILEKLDIPISIIDAQIKTFEENKKAEKEAELKEYYNSLYNFAYIDVAYEQIKKDNWLNATFTIKKAKAEIEDIVKKIESDVDNIRELKSQFETALLQKYKETLELGEVLKYKQTLEQQETKSNFVTKPTPVNKIEQNEKQYSISFTVKGSLAQMTNLRNYLKDNNYTFEINK